MFEFDAVEWHILVQSGVLL